MEDFRREGDSFVLGEDGKEITARIDFHRSPDSTIVIDHTEVARQHQGQGVGLLLVDMVVALARKEGAKIVPVCGYAKKILSKGAEYADVLKADHS